MTTRPADALSVCAEQARAWSRLSGLVGEAVCTSTKAVLYTQAVAARACAERVANDPRSSKMAVEGAHQAYDLVVAFTEANAGFCDAWLAAVRSLEKPGSTGRR